MNKQNTTAYRTVLMFSDLLIAAGGSIPFGLAVLRTTGDPVSASFVAIGSFFALTHLKFPRGGTDRLPNYD